jgi:catechol 2,3-dioxygenase-like lactoylglutathione lyase family enzyme
MEIRIEVVMLGVADPARSREFYERIGFHIDHDVQVDDATWFIQATPPGSACSIAFGRGLSPMQPGEQKGIMAVVPDADEARQALLEAGADCSEVDEQVWGRFVSFQDPDQNAWTYQELPARG